MKTSLILMNGGAQSLCTKCLICISCTYRPDHASINCPLTDRPETDLHTLFFQNKLPFAVPLLHTCDTHVLTTANSNESRKMVTISTNIVS